MKRARRRVFGERLIEVIALACGCGYVFGYLCWRFFAALWGPGAAWAIAFVFWVGLPAAFLAGRSCRSPCRRCEEGDRTIRLLEDRAVELQRKCDRLNEEMLDAIAASRVRDRAQPDRSRSQRTA